MSLCRRVNGFLEREIDGEVLLLDTESDQIHQLNKTATYIWRKCEEGVSAAEIAASLAESFDVEEDNVRADIERTIDLDSMQVSPYPHALCLKRRPPEYCQPAAARGGVPGEVPSGSCCTGAPAHQRNGGRRLYLTALNALSTACSMRRCPSRSTGRPLPLLWPS